ncbi:MAG TPA: outer membrane protein assembly factor BamD [Blastocatellia bacterium]|nr:outer membrane protein assembly factor BamD [Blastocatellia bacterium]
MKGHFRRNAVLISRGGVMLCAVVLLAAGTAFSQQGPARGKLEGIKDPELETSSKHNLEVAKWYLNKRKAYPGARDRLQEIMDTYPDFSQIDEVIYLMGEVNEKLHKNEEAGKYYNQIVTSYPGSQFFKKAKDKLAELKVDLKSAPDSKAGTDDSTKAQPPNNSPDKAKKQDSSGTPPPF